MKTSRIKGIIAGSFDLIHPGYIKMFEDAKKNACNYLIIALQTDPTVERPNKCKPVQSADDREYILRSIRYIDEVVRYTTELELLKILETYDYDIRVIGSDYSKKSGFTGSNINKQIYFHKRDHNYSLTGLKKKIIKMGVS